MASKIDVVSSCIVPMAATNNTSISNISRIALTPWELSFLLLEPIQKGILLHKPYPDTASETLINHLKNSLSTTLSFFPTLAGRLATVKHGDGAMCFFVDCNNSGAEFTHAVARDVPVSDIIESRYTPGIVSSFFPLNGVLNYEGLSKPLLAVQVTELTNGLFIGCTINHSIIDGSSFWHFFNSWSEISRGLNKLSKNPTFDRWFPSNVSKENPLIPVSLPNQSQLQNFTQVPLLERVFHFSQESIQNLKAKANSQAGTEKISSLQALIAHIWRTVVRIRYTHKIGTKTTQKAVLFLLVGARERIPLPAGYFGTAAYVDEAAVSVAEILKNKLGFAAVKVNELVAKQTRLAAVKYAENWVKNPVMFTRGCTDFAISSSPRFDVYGCDFGWGKPIAVRSGKAQKCDGKMTFYPAAESGGINVEVCLARETMKAMEEDVEFLEVVTL